MQTKHDANLDFLFLMQMPFIKMQMQNAHMMHMFSFQRCNFHDADVLCSDENMKFIHDGTSAHIQIAMQMSTCKDGDAKYLVVQMPSSGYVMMQMSFGACYDANVRLGVCYDANAPCRYAMMRMFM